MKKKLTKKKMDTVLYIRLNQDLLDEIDKYAVKMELDRSRFVRNLLESGLDDVKLMDKFGIYSLISFVRKNNIKPQEIFRLALDQEVS
jgi:metal-responsive CopG/Arc/MetJ family transcriptional regulator